MEWTGQLMKLCVAENNKTVDATNPDRTVPIWASISDSVSSL